VAQCGRVGVPPVSAKSAAASRCADGEAADPVCRIVHASRIASSISKSVTLITSRMPLDGPAYPEPRYGASQEGASMDHAEPLAPSSW